MFIFIGGIIHSTVKIRLSNIQFPIYQSNGKCSDHCMQSRSVDAIQWKT